MPHTPRILVTAGALLAALGLTSTAAHAARTGELTGRAAVPAGTFADGPPSGARITGSTNGVPVPFATQPVQGFSGVVFAGTNKLLGLEDNGYGALENSADFNLRVYTLRPNFDTGKVNVLSYIELKDPDHEVPFTVVNDDTRDRVLTGADFDPESIQKDKDGTLWIGEEFGPSLLHVDRGGTLLDPPVALPDADKPGQDIRSPQSPSSEESAPQRILNALNARGKARGATVAPVVSPDATLIADGDPATKAGSRPDQSQVSSELFDVTKLHAAGYEVVPYTVDDPAQMDKLLKLGVDGLISDRSDLLHQRVAAFDADGDGTSGDYLLPDGRIDPAKFDAQGHRGSRDLRPENTLPAMEAGLDNLINTLETDNGITADGTPVLDHEPYVSSVRCRRADGTPYGPADEVLVQSLTFKQLQDTFTCDKRFRGPQQTSDPAASPVVAAYQAAKGLRDPYVMPSDQQLFDFVDFYAAYYATGAGKDTPGAAAKAANAATVRFNVETKLNPRTDRDAYGNVYAQRTVGPKQFADYVTGAIAQAGKTDRATLQSFDLRTLQRAQDTRPELKLVTLWGDTQKGAGIDDDGTNLQPQPGQRTSPWLGGYVWPYRQTASSTPFRAQSSGGFEGMARSENGRYLLPMLEKPLTGDPANTLLISQWDTKTKQWTGKRWRFPFTTGAVSIGDFQLADDKEGLVLERDNGQGTAARFKQVTELTLDKRGDGRTVATAPLLDELKIDDPAGISLESPFDQPGDHLVGRTFGLPFTTIESLLILDRRNVLIGVDNNFPFSLGRHLGTGAPDDSEFVTVNLPRKVG